MQITLYLNRLMTNKKNIEILNFVTKKNLNQNNYVQLAFPYLDQYFCWYKFKIKFWKYISDVFNDFLEARKVIGDIYTYPKTYINSVINNPIEFEIPIHSLFEVSLKEMKFEDLDHYMDMNFDDVKRIYDEIKSSMNETLEASNLIELRCDKVQDKLITVRAKEIISVQIYEKSSVAGGAKRPGFSLNMD